ncbi:MAG: aldehyde ferredoxin oxidoreductase family protein [Clostridia bacterium]
MATKYGAYTGQIIKIDLSTRTVSEYPISDEDRKLFLGGKIMAAKIMNDHLNALGVHGSFDALSESNAIIVSTCPLNAMGSPSSSRFNTSTISPLTGIYTSSNCGGNFGLHLKRCGYDALIIVGKCSEHIYLKINADFKVEFLNADKLWGLKTNETQEAIVGNGGKFVIGPAGENLVKYACVVSEERAAGRGGVGAVFGSKNLKAIYCQGIKSPTAYDKAGLQKVNAEWTAHLKNHPVTGLQLPAMGTAALIAPMHAKNMLATKNYSSGKYEKFEDISGETMSENFLVRKKGCVTCPIQCARFVNVKGKVVKGPEVETVGLFGANILNNNLQKILDWNNEMDELGLDTISCGNTIAYAMEANEKHLWDSGLEFGKIDNISDILVKIAHRSGVGDDLANGSRWCAEKYGGKEFAMNAKGMELAAYEPRGAVGQGLGYAVGNRGGCHLNGGYMVVMEGLGLSINPYTTGAKAGLTCMFQDLMEACSAGGNCLFTTYAFFPSILIKKPHNLITRAVNRFATKFGGPVRLILRFPRLLHLNMPADMLPHTKALTKATGMKIKFGDFLRIGERGYNLERLIDVKLGITSKDDTLPAKLTDELQIKDNPKSKVPLEKLKKEYYKNRCWDNNGVPTKKLVKRLKLEGLVK